MITAFILGSMMGLGIGWRLSQKRYDGVLATSTKQLKQATEALGKANAEQFALAARLNAANATLTALNQPRNNNTEDFAG